MWSKCDCVMEAVYKEQDKGSTRKEVVMTVDKLQIADGKGEVNVGDDDPLEVYVPCSVVTV